MYGLIFFGVKQDVRASATMDESVISEPEVGMSALWVAQTALAVTRERFHQERTARKALEQGSLCMVTLAISISDGTRRISMPQTRRSVGRSRDISAFLREPRR